MHINWNVYGRGFSRAAFGFVYGVPKSRILAAFREERERRKKKDLSLAETC